MNRAIDNEYASERTFPFFLSASSSIRKLLIAWKAPKKILTKGIGSWKSTEKCRKLWWLNVYKCVPGEDTNGFYVNLCRGAKKKRMLRGRCEHKSCYLLRGEEIQVIEAVVDVRKFAIKNYLFVELRLLLVERRRFILFCVLPSFASTYMRYKNSKFMLW